MNTYTENILEVYNLATNWDIKSGVAWYQGAHEHARKLADRYETTLETAMAVVSALSPRNKWSNNLKDADTVLAAVYSGARHPFDLKVHTTYTNRDKAFSIEKTGNLDLLTGAKVTAFFDNILNYKDSTDVTVDVHAYRVSQGDFDVKAKTLTDTEIVEIKNAYTEASQRIGLSPLEIQAVTWIVARRYRKAKVTGQQLPLF